jgi:hypothetical protein
MWLFGLPDGQTLGASAKFIRASFGSTSCVRSTARKTCARGEVNVRETLFLLEYLAADVRNPVPGGSAVPLTEGTVPHCAPARWLAWHVRSIPYPQPF